MRASYTGANCAGVAHRTSALVARGVAVIACFALLGVTFSVLPGIVRAAHVPALSATSDNVTIDATTDLTFVPSSFSVYPGAMVHLKLVQQASTAHTFNLSSDRNATIPTGDTTSEVEAFLQAHGVFVQHNLGSVPGNTTYLNFTAPGVGTYEYVCVLHFSDGMRGVMTSTRGTPPSPSALPVPPVDLAIFGGVVIAIVALVLFLLRPGRQARQAREEEIARNSARRRRPPT